MKEIYEMKGAGRSIRGIADELGIARNTVRKYLKSPEAIRPKPRRPRASKLDPYREYVDRRLAEGLENCVVLHWELTGLGYDGGYSILKSYVSPRRRQPDATMLFETAPGEQAQVDWGSLAYLGQDGKKRRVWAFVMTLGLDLPSSKFLLVMFPPVSVSPGLVRVKPFLREPRLRPPRPADARANPRIR